MDREFWDKMREKDYNELLDYLDFVIEEKKNLTKQIGRKDIYHHMQAYFRLMALAMTLTYVKAEYASMTTQIIINVLTTGEQKAEIVALLEKADQEYTEKVLKEIEEHRRRKRG